jgi:protein O-mannose beta-1,4-N-acetylglucosaminyltransferase
LDLTTVQNHNLYYFSHIEALPSAFSHVPVRYEQQRHYIFGRLVHNNNMHTLHDDALGLWMLMKEYESAPFNQESFSRMNRLLAFDMYMDGPTSESLQYLSHFPIRYKSYLHQGVMTCFRDAIVGNRKSLTWYQYGFFGFQGPIQNKTVPGHTIHHIAQWYKSNLKKPLVKGPDVIVLLERTRNRLIINQNDLILALEAQFKMKVVVVSNENHSFEEQIHWMHRAKMVISMHGGLLIMILFCRPGTIVLEMFPFAFPAEDYTPYKTLANLRGMDLKYVAWQVRVTGLFIVRI